MKTGSIKAVSYARVSSEEQKQGYSIAAQQESIREYAERQQMHIVNEFSAVETAKKAGRTGFGRMLTFLESNPDVKIILVEKTDRLYRNFRDYVLLDELISDSSLEVHLVKENQILRKESRSDAKFIHGLNVLQAKKYIDNLSEEVKKGMLQKAKQGRYPGGSIAIGYLLDKNSDTINIDPLRAPIVSEIFERYAERRGSLRTIAAWARSQGLTGSRRGNPVTTCQIERILKNPFYFGEFRWAGRTFIGNHQSLISKQLFDQVQQTLNSHNKANPNRRRFAFGNLLHCATCGCAITGEFRKQKYTYYHCTGMRGGDHLVYVPEPELIRQFTDHIQRVALTPQHTAQILDGLHEWNSITDGNHEARRARIQARIGQLDTWTERAYLDKLDGKIGEDQWETLTAKWNAERSEFRSQLRASSQRDELIYTAKELLELMEAFPRLWDTRNTNEKREMVDLVYWNSLLDGATLRPTYRKPFSYIAEGHQSQIWRG